jgi:hypothetical protein
MAASDYAYYNHELHEYGYYTEDGCWHPMTDTPNGAIDV